MERFFFRCNNITPKELKQLIAKHGTDILVGVDPGLNTKPDEDANILLTTMESSGVSKHVYLVGPGMWSWSSEERKQIKEFASSVGINIDEEGWKEKWFSSGWKTKVQRLIYYYKNIWNVNSFEIDNLDSAKNFNIVEFIKNEWPSMSGGSLLMLKNVSEDDLEEILTLDPVHLLRLSPFAMFEEGTGDPETQIRLCEDMGIKAITPINGIRDTNDYGVIDEGIPAL